MNLTSVLFGPNDSKQHTFQQLIKQKGMLEFMLVQQDRNPYIVFHNISFCELGEDPLDAQIGETVAK